MSDRFRVVSLASGSSGNAFYAESAEGAILVDAGLPGKRVEELIRRAGGEPGRVQAILVTHDHTDHVRGAGILHRQHGWPLLMTRGTRQRAEKRLGRVSPTLFPPGAVLRVAGFRVETIPTPHDGAEPVMAVLERGQWRCGVFTDLGHPFPALREALGTLDGVFLESNYDRPLLDANPNYPDRLKRRIVSPRGHLENRETGALLAACAGERLRRVMLSHLSEQNNRPEIALVAVRASTGDLFRERGVKIAAAPRHAPSQTMLFGFDAASA